MALYAYLVRGIAKHLVANKQQPTPDILHKKVQSSNRNVMFILATLVNWRFPKQRMKLDASSICISNLLLLVANIHNYFQKRITFRLLLFASTKITYLYAKQLHKLLFLSMLSFLYALICQCIFKLSASTCISFVTLFCL